MVQRGCNGSALGARAVRDAFYVQRASWQRRVVRRGVALGRTAGSERSRGRARSHPRVRCGHGLLAP